MPGSEAKGGLGVGHPSLARKISLPMTFLGQGTKPLNPQWKRRSNTGKVTALKSHTCVRDTWPPLPSLVSILRRGRGGTVLQSCRGEGKACRGGEDGKRLGQQEAGKLHPWLTCSRSLLGRACLATWNCLEFKPSAHSANTVGLWS